MRTIVQAGNPMLRQVAKEIAVADIRSKEIQKLIADMKTLLAKEEFGVALAAPQVGKSLRLFIVSGKALTKRRAKYREIEEDQAGKSPSGDLSAEDEVYISPVLIKMSRGKKPKHEGCLSVRGKWGLVPRAEKVTLRAYNEKGMAFTRGASGLLAHIFQHELDHLEGVLYTDKAAELYDEKKSANDP